MAVEHVHTPWTMPMEQRNKIGLRKGQGYPEVIKCEKYTNTGVVKKQKRKKEREKKKKNFKEKKLLRKERKEQYKKYRAKYGDLKPSEIHDNTIIGSSSSEEEEPDEEMLALEDKKDVEGLTKKQRPLMLTHKEEFE